GGHSLMAIRMFSQIEAELKQKLPYAILFQSPTIAGLAEALRSEQPAQWPTLVPMQPKGTRPPLFCMPGFGGGVLDFAEMARLLGDDQPVYGLMALGLDGDAPPHETIESM